MTDLTASLERRGEFVWEIPQSFRADMRVPARVYTDESSLPALAAEHSLEQLVNVATLPGSERYALAMPDVHQGYGFPVGGVAAIRTRDGVISPGGIGYDINCGVRLLAAECRTADIEQAVEGFATELQRDVPSGLGRSGGLELPSDELERVLDEGVAWAVRRGYADEADRDAIEERGRFTGADPEAVSPAAKERGRGQLGTIGSGNHFVEVQTVERVYDAAAATAYGLFEGQLCVMVHTGSRGLGHQTCTDYVRRMGPVMEAHGITVPDRELACAPFRSEEGRRYFGAMAAAANFAWVNRQVITHRIREAFMRAARGRVPPHLRLVYDVSHNIAKLERYGNEELVVHRKGATRAFGPGRPELPAWCRETGQPVLIPGSMGTASYVLAGTRGALHDTFGTCCHGAGRRLSRMRAKKTLDYAKLLDELARRGVAVRAGSARGLIEEAPAAYKDVDAVVKTVAGSGIGKLVARLVPRAVVKG